MYKGFPFVFFLSFTDKWVPPFLSYTDSLVNVRVEMISFFPFPFFHCQVGPTLPFIHGQFIKCPCTKCFVFLFTFHFPLCHWQSGSHPSCYTRIIIKWTCTIIARNLDIFSKLRCRYFPFFLLFLVPLCHWQVVPNYLHEPPFQIFYCSLMLP